MLAKKVVGVAVFVSVVFCLFNSEVLATGTYAGGTGDPNDPFQIAEPKQLIEIRQHSEDWDKHFVLTDDLNMNLADSNTFAGSVIASYFTGVFDGNGHTISNLTIVGVDYYSLGLFGSIQGANAEVKNLGLENINVTGGYNSVDVGGLCGYSSGKISNCYSNGSITGGNHSGGRIGGLCGSIWQGSISDCYATGLVNGANSESYSAGGLCGSNYDGCINNCYATGSVISNTSSEFHGLGGLCGSNGGCINNCYATGSVNGGDDSHNLGGLCGRNGGGVSNCYATGTINSGDNSDYLGGLCGTNGGSISDCYATGLVTGGIGSGNLGGLCGGGSSIIINCYFLDTAGPDNGFGQPLDDPNMRTKSNFAGWDYTDETTNGTSSTWIIHVGEYPSLFYFDPTFVPHSFVGQGTAQDPYLIFDPNDLGAIQQQPDRHYRLQNHLDLAAINWSVAVIPDFIGVFDGNGHTISNLNISGGGYLGFVGFSTRNTIIRNLGLENVNITGYAFLGGLCGVNYGDIMDCYSNGSVTGDGYLGGLCGLNEEYTTIINCHATGPVTGGNNSYYLGGLCGRNYEGIISNCHATGPVIGGDDSDCLGGLCGYSYSDGGGGSISYSYATGSVTGGDNSDYVGGLCGYNNWSTISNCYATGAVSGGNESQSLGGLCGHNDEHISNCYATGLVTGGDNSDSLGGLCGYNHKGNISNCYSNGSVNGGAGSVNLGGLCGYNDVGSINHCYFLDTAGPHNGYGTPLDDPNMRIQSNFIDWDFDPGDGDPADWFMSLLNYPKLSWQQTIAYDGQTKITIPKGDSRTITIDIFSRIEQTLNWTITGHESCSWITNLSPDSDISTGPTDRTTVTICIDTTALNRGNYLCELILSADNDDNVILYVSLHIPLAGAGTQASPFVIQNFIDFQVFSDAANAAIYWADGVCTRLDCDLDLNPILPDRQIYTNAVIAPDTDNSNSDFDGTVYQGVFNGNGYIISNLTIDTDGAENDYLGLFGEIFHILHLNTQVKYLGLKDVHITGGDNSDYLGGLCGYTHSDIKNCFVIGSISGGDNAKYLGGLCGVNDGDISNCYASCSVNGGTNSYDLGGLCGANYNGDISYCYSTGLVTAGAGSDHLGGLCGENDYDIYNCYFLNTAGPDHGDGEPLDDPNMKIQNSFVNWDFVGEETNGTDDHWQMCIDGYDYPRLAWQFINPADFLHPGRVDTYDLFVFTQDWLSMDSPCCDIAPTDNPDGIVNLFDYIELSRYWLNE